MSDHQRLSRDVAAQIGAEGETFAQLFLWQHFGYSARPTPDPGIDWQCGGLIGAPASPLFHVQVKATRAQPARSVRVKRRTFLYWLELVENEPVILLLIADRGHSDREVRFLILHDWLLEHIENEQVFRGSGTVHFHLGDFEVIRAPDGSDFRGALYREAARASASPGALFGTARTARLFLMDEVQLLCDVERVEYFEVPDKVLRELVDDRRLTDYRQLRTIARTLWADRSRWSPSFAEWMADIAEAVPLMAPGDSHQRKQFAYFIKSMKAYRDGREIPLPRFTVGNVICWRAFAATYPESLSMFEAVLRSPTGRTADELAFVLCLVSVLVNTGLRPLESRAADAFRLIAPAIPSTPTSLASYTLAREYYKNLIEAGIASDVERDRGIHILRVSGAAGWEAEHLRRYGWGSQTGVIQNLQRKLRLPKVRDLNTVSFHEAQLTLFKRG